VALRVSAGVLPTIAGSSFEEAKAALDEVEVFVESAPQELYSDEVAKGVVIGIDGSPTVRPGDTVLLNVSLGPEPVDVPAIVGMNWPAAKQALADAGLDFEYWNENSRRIGSSEIAGFATVQAIDPDGGQLPKGSKVRVRLSAFG
jgi:beta-lactam-binding protein with PASTA domain